MRVYTGFLLTLIFIFIFSFSFIGFNNEVQQAASFDRVLDENIIFEELFFSSNSYMYDKDGKLISEIYSAENRNYLDYNDIPSFFIMAAVATEDRQFFHHKGFDMNGITRAFFINATGDNISQGGSTITQQLVKNLYLSNERTYNRKLSELLYAYQFEKNFSKEEILEFYLNSVYFQNGVYGVEAASQYYFSRPATELSLAEAAFLFAIPNNPSLYNPLTNPENTHVRKEWILLKMLETNFINEEAFENAKEEPIELTLSSKIDAYPDYVTYIHYELELLVGEHEGLNELINQADSQEEKAPLVEIRRGKTEHLLESGVHIYTALDREKQASIINNVNRFLPQADIEAAIVIVDHNTNEIVAISGGKNYEKFNFHRGFQAFRQPGSAIKPLLVFAPYFSERTVSPNSIINAGPFCKNGYCPRNYGGGIYGNVTFETALKHSYNTAAVRMLDQIGIRTGFDYFNQLGFSQIASTDYVLPSAIGGLTYGVSPLEMTAAYSTFATDGYFRQPRGIVKITDQDGNILYHWNEEIYKLWDQETNRKMRQMLTKVVTEGTGRAAYFNSNYIGGKTGTSNDYHDLWFVGSNEHYTTGIWLGKDTPASLISINSRNPHLLIWREIMRN